MKTLWAPWRMQYILGKRDNTAGCIFEAGAPAPYSRDHLVLYRDRESVALLNRFPYANGHLLIAPGRHVPDLQDLADAENLALVRLLRQSVAILRLHLRPDGFNIGLNLGRVAGAGLADHLHWHVVPRWDGDHNFITVLGEVRTIPQHLEATFDKLLPDFQGLLDNRPKTP